jgi:NitT/TauT family transport system ATP-binding protein
MSASAGRDSQVLNPKIAIEGLSYRYEGRGAAVEALRSISFTCYEREIVAVVGPSGCGKSTLVGLIAGLKRPSSGSISIDGTVVSGPSRDVGVMFQKNTLLPWRSIVENVELGLEIRGGSKSSRREATLALIAKYGLGGFERKYPHALSGGMQKRAALIQTLAYNPGILLLDEAFAALDAQTRVLIQDEFVKITRAEGKTVLMVTHDIGEAIALADRIIVLSARPAAVKANHEIRFPKERESLLAVSSTPEYQDYFKMIWGQLEVSNVSF